MNDLLKQKFIKVYSNLPIKTREEIILNLSEFGPITWNAAYVEIKNTTKLGESILRDLNDLDFI